MEKLTNKEQLVLQQIREFIARSEKMTIRALQTALGYASPRSISVLVDQLITKGWIYRDSQDQIRISPDFRSDSHEVRMIPLIGTIACGMPIFADENIETEIPVSTRLVSTAKKYFFLRAQGDSMNQKGIDDGDLVLIEQTSVPQDGQIVAALINDEATLKEFRHEGDLAYLIPHSDNPRHRPIILGDFTDNFSIQGVFVRSFPGSLFA
jgi:repressor LexA